MKLEEKQQIKDVFTSSLQMLINAKAGSESATEMTTAQQDEFYTDGILRLTCGVVELLSPEVILSR